MSLNKLSTLATGYDLKLNLGADALKCNDLEVVNDMTVAGDLEVANDLLIGGETSLNATAYPSGLVRPMGRLYSMITQKAVVLTSPVSIFDDTSAIGSRTIPPNASKVGDVYTFKASGHLTTNGTISITISPLINGSTWDVAKVEAVNSATRVLWDLEYRVAITELGAGGKARATCVFLFGFGSPGYTEWTVADTINVDTTSNIELDFDAEWSASDPSNVLTSQIATLTLT